MSSFWTVFLHIYLGTAKEQRFNWLCLHMGAERLWDRFIPATCVTKPLSCVLNFIVKRMGLWEQARARLSSHRGRVDQEGGDKEGRRALGRADWVSGCQDVSRAGCCHCSCTAASAHAGTSGTSASCPWASAEQARHDFCETELSEGVRRVKCSVCVSNDAVMMFSCRVM